MKQRLIFLALVAALAIGLPAAVWAQDPAATPADAAPAATAAPADGGGAATAAPAQGQGQQGQAVAMNAVNVKATDLKGFTVRNSNGDDLGSISDVLVMAADGRIPFVAVSFGGFLGIGEKVVPVPAQAVKLNAADKMAVIDIPADTLKNAPNIDPNNWPSLAVEGWDKQYVDYWTQAGLNLQGAAQNNAPLQARPQAAPAAGAQPGQSQNVVVGAVRQGDIMDFDVYNANNDKVGDITDLIYDWQNATVSYALLDWTPPADTSVPAAAPNANAPVANPPAAVPNNTVPGDNTAMGANGAGNTAVGNAAVATRKLIPVPWGKLTLDPLNKKFLLDTSKIDLTQAPGFDPSTMPDFTIQNWDDNVRGFWDKLTS